MDLSSEICCDWESVDFCCAKKEVSRNVKRAASPAGSWGGGRESELRKGFSAERRVLSDAALLTPVKKRRPGQDAKTR